ncbi:MAG: hypothetical protein CM1200mP8_3650 [Chloroflexota bacterium]|nr:MAG: hypothetical protein CM1200mP8_3650 [Chloroflexota bacterium]
MLLLPFIDMRCRVLDDHVAKILKIQRDRRDTMIATLGEIFGSNAKWSTPGGGLYLWLEMPHSADLTEITGEALNAGVGYQPGPMFAADASSGHNYARLFFRLQFVRRNRPRNRSFIRSFYPERIFLINVCCATNLSIYLFSGKFGF